MLCPLRVWGCANRTPRQSSHRRWRYAAGGPKFNVDVAHAAVDLSSEHANRLVKQLLDSYEAEIETAPVGKRYQECFDLGTGKPSDDYLRLYEEMVKELTNLGLPF